MRKLAVVASAALALGSISAGPAWADHGDGSSPDDVVVLATVTDFDKDDRGEEGPSKGDRFSYRATLEDEDGDDAGRSRGGCILTDADGHHDGGGHHGGGHHGQMSAQGHSDDDGHDDLVARCGAGFALDDGKLFIAGTVEKGDMKDGEVTLPIKGGSGEYEDAEGEATITFLKGHHGDGGSHGHDASYEAADHGETKDDHHEGPHFKVSFDFE